MTPSARRIAPSDRVVRALANVRRLVMAQHASRALRLLDLLRSAVENPGSRFELETLRIQALIDQGQYREAAAALESARTLASEPDQQDDLDLLDAHRLARLSAARSALRGAFAVLKRHRMGDRAAKAHWIAGVSLYRAAHYKWAKDCFELSAAHYRLSRQPVYLALMCQKYYAAAASLSAMVSKSLRVGRFLESVRVARPFGRCRMPALLKSS